MSLNVVVQYVQCHVVNLCIPESFYEGNYRNKEEVSAMYHLLELNVENPALVTAQHSA